MAEKDGDMAEEEEEDALLGPLYAERQVGLGLGLTDEDAARDLPGDDPVAELRCRAALVLALSLARARVLARARALAGARVRVRAVGRGHSEALGVRRETLKMLLWQKKQKNKFLFIVLLYIPPNTNNKN